MKKSFIIVTVVFTLGLATSFASDKTKSANDAIAPLMQELLKYQHAENAHFDETVLLFILIDRLFY
ncbi:MAG: hypothetical protein RL248_1248 [Pseudomonadota bacterium]|jgi:hypothetical protein